jgi:hypothetical protein
MLEAVCRNSWLDGDELMALLAPDESPKLGASAHKGVGPEGFPTIGEWTYCPHWKPQVEEAVELIGDNATITLGEPIYVKDMEKAPGTVTFVTACPATQADLQEVGIACLLIHPYYPHAPCTHTSIVVVGLEDTTLVNLIYLLKWMDGRPLVVWHRWEPRDEVPWRGSYSPPMALEVVASVAHETPPGELLGEWNEVTGLDYWPGDFWSIHAGMGVPGYQMVSKRTYQKEVEVNDVVYVEGPGVHAIVTRIKKGRVAKPGMIRGCGPSTLYLRCGLMGRNEHVFTVPSDSSYVWGAREQTKSQLPRMGDRLEIRARIPGCDEEGGDAGPSS